jgi:hypothetical protein
MTRTWSLYMKMHNIYVLKPEGGELSIDPPPNCASLDSTQIRRGTIYFDSNLHVHEVDPLRYVAAQSSPSSADLLKELTSSLYLYQHQQEPRSLGAILRGQLPSLCTQWGPYLDPRDHRKTAFGILVRNGCIYR